jgi:hypothetical protein
MSFIDTSPTCFNWLECYNLNDRCSRLYEREEGTLKIDEIRYQGIVTSSYQTIEHPVSKKSVFTETADEYLNEVYQLYPERVMTTKLITCNLCLDRCKNYVDLDTQSLRRRGYKVFAKGVTQLTNDPKRYPHIESSGYKSWRNNEKVGVKVYLGFVSYFKP